MRGEAEASDRTLQSHVQQRCHEGSTWGSQDGEMWWKKVKRGVPALLRDLRAREAPNRGHVVEAQEEN